MCKHVSCAEAQAEASMGVEGCLPPGSQGQGRLQARAAGAPEGDSCHSTHTGGLGPPGPGTENSRGCPWRSYRPPLGKTCSRSQPPPPRPSLSPPARPLTAVPPRGRPCWFSVLSPNLLGPVLSPVQPQPHSCHSSPPKSIRWELFISPS